MPDAEFEKARRRLASAASVAVLTGAGISAESGIPTFRGAGGLWKNFRPEELATPEAFARNPRLVWEWYDWRRQAIAKAGPNPAHRGLVQLEQAKPRFTLITQNVDGLHDAAGSRRILKLHGDIWHLRCTACGADWIDRRAPLDTIPPLCACGAQARPGVVWFGEMLPPGILDEAQRAAAAAQVFLVIGTSALVYPAAALAPYARRSGATVIEINLEPTPFSDIVDFAFHGKAGDLLPKLV
ncbi:MAG TPA: NAD-dependent deacylase [Bryobacteraceae bacterium]|nr:NAD-dependent deacylase [Bryobacteraceae bacterium]